jgi:hypothetical protein
MEGAGMNLTRTEPVGIAGAAIVLVNSVIGLAQVFGLADWSADQVAAVNLVLVNLATIAALVWSRSKVFSPATIVGQEPADLGGDEPITE